MPNTDISPDLFKVKGQNLHNDTRTYQCQCCGWATPPVKDGKELREVVRQRHLCFPR